MEGRKSETEKDNATDDTEACRGGVVHGDVSKSVVSCKFSVQKEQNVAWMK